MLDNLLARAKQSIAALISRALPNLLLTEEGPDQVRELGHRRYIGGDWEAWGEAAFAFLRHRGLRPDHVLLDLACGSFRLGVKAIPYLEAGNYLGLDREGSLVAAGLEHEVGPALAEAKRPEIVISEDFEFERFSKHADIVVAFSLFTHLTPAAIDRCLIKLHAYLDPEARFYVTYRERRGFWRNPAQSNAFASFRYKRSEMEDFAHRNGFTSEYIGEWRPDAIQSMICMRKR